MKEMEVKLPVGLDTGERVQAAAVSAEAEWATDAYHDTQGRGRLRIRSVEKGYLDLILEQQRGRD